MKTVYRKPVFILLSVFVIGGVVLSTKVFYGEEKQYIDKSPYIYISTSHGQMMGLMLGRDTIYIGYDGYVQKVKEEYGMADTIQELKEGQLGRDKTLKLFSLLEGTIKGKSPFKNSKNGIKDALSDSTNLQEYYSPSTIFELLTPNKELYTRYYDSDEPDTDKSVKHLIEIINTSLNEVKFTKNKAARFIRTHEVKDKSTIKQYKRDSLIEEVTLDELAKTKTVLFSVSNERRLIPIGGEYPFVPLKFFRWPYEWPYAVEVKVKGKVYSIRCKVRKEKTDEQEKF